MKTDSKTLKCGQCAQFHPLYETDRLNLGHCTAFNATTHEGFNCFSERKITRAHGLLIYVSSPYSVGDIGSNVHVQLNAAHRIMDAGHAPLWPLASHYLHLHRPRPYEDWMHVDLVTIDRCDVLLRLKGESPGGDREVARAYSQGKLVLYGWEEFDAFCELLKSTNGDPTSIDRNSIEAVILKNIADSTSYDE